VERKANENKTRLEVRFHKTMYNEDERSVQKRGDNKNRLEGPVGW